MSLEEEELITSQQNGRWGFVLTPDKIPTGLQPVEGLTVGASMLVADVPAWMARQWTVDLFAHRYSSGTLANPGAPAVEPFGRPPDNQLDSRLFYAKVIYGVDGSSETAYVDYYERGCTFNVHAASIKVDIVASLPADFPNGPQPTLAGALSPSHSSGRAGPAVSPTFTPFGIQNVLAGQTLIVPVPARAVAYRVNARGVIAADIQLDQLREDLATVNWVDSFGIATGAGSIPATYSDGYFPLHPSTNYVRFANTGAGARTLWMNFLLDLG